MGVDALPLLQLIATIGQSTIEQNGKIDGSRRIFSLAFIS